MSDDGQVVTRTSLAVTEQLMNEWAKENIALEHYHRDSSVTISVILV